MAENITDKPNKGKPNIGTWERLGQAKGLTFELDKPILVTFLEDTPEEVPSTLEEDAVYYKFSVKLMDGTETTIDTSAWTLLGALKKLSPLKGKLVQIVKKLEKGKQTFSVVEIIKP